ncbi:MAG TPA: hypothetical protein VII60_07845 [Acidimicrobiales bacterium]
MSDSPKRSRRDMVGQLVVILILMAILVGAIVFLHQYVTSHSSAPATSRTSQSAVSAPWSARASADGHAAIDGNIRASYG